MYNKYKNDPLFTYLLTFARILNAIHFCRYSLTNLEYTSSKPSEIRSDINSFFFACGVLHEGIDVLRKSSNLFKNFSTYKNNVPLFLKKTKSFNNTILSKLRNEAVFHYDNLAFQKTIQTLELDEYEFSISLGKTRGSIYYSLADQIALNTLASGLKTKEEEDTFTKRVANNIVKYTDEYVNIVTALMTEVIDELGLFSVNT